LKRAQSELEAKQRQWAVAKETLATQIKLLEIDLAAAELQLEHASDEESRARALKDRHAISTEEYNQKRLDQKKAVLQVERARTLLELYRNVLPDQKPATDKDGGADKTKSGRPGAADRPERNDGE